MTSSRRLTLVGSGTNAGASAPPPTPPSKGAFGVDIIELGETRLEVRQDTFIISVSPLSASVQAGLKKIAEIKKVFTSNKIPHETYERHDPDDRAKKVPDAIIIRRPAL